MQGQDIPFRDIGILLTLRVAHVEVRGRHAASEVRAAGARRCGRGAACRASDELVEATIRVGEPAREGDRFIQNRQSCLSQLCYEETVLPRLRPHD